MKKTIAIMLAVIMLLLTGCYSSDDVEKARREGYEDGYEEGFATGYEKGSVDGYAQAVEEIEWQLDIDVPWA